MSKKEIIFDDLNCESLGEFLKKYEGTLDRDLLVQIWLYGEQKWSNGYNQGKNNPDFD